MTAQCPGCGYTERDAAINGDHRLCKNSGNAPWEKRTNKHSAAATAATIVVNIRRRVHSSIKPDFDVYIGRPSIFGNPFRVGIDGSRDEVVAKHMTYARDRIKHDPVFRNKVKSLYGKRLGCYCHPLACHGDNYVVLADELNH